MAASLFTTLQTADRLLGDLQAQRLLAQVHRVPASAPPPTHPAAPPAPGGPRHGLSGVSVPRILLTLGALCLLVAAITFLAVAWAWLGVGGRTAVLVGLTLVAGLAAAWAHRTGLRAGAESLSVVALGLLLLDLVGAEDAGWLGTLSDSGLVVVAGTVLGTVSLAAAVLARGRLVSPQVVGAAAWWAVVGAAADLTGHEATSFAVGCAGLLGLAVAGRRVALPVFPWLTLGAAATWWLALTGTGLGRMADSGSLHGLWVEGAAWPTVAAAVLAASPLLALATRAWARLVFAGTAALLVTATATFPVLDETTTRSAGCFLVAVAAWSIATVVVPAHWRAAALPSLVGASLVPAVVLLGLAGEIVDNLVDRDPWTVPASSDVPEVVVSSAPVLLVAGTVVAALALVAVSRAVGRPRLELADLGFLTAATALAGTGVLATHTVPLVLVVGCLVTVAAGLVGWATTRTDPRGELAALVGILGLAATLPVAAASVGLTALVLGIAAGVMAVVAWRGGSEPQRGAGLALLPLALGGLCWTLGELAVLADEWRTIPVLLTVGLLAVGRARFPLEISAALTAAVAGAVSVGAAWQPDESHGRTVLAIVLTLAGGLVVASSLVNAHRRLLGWPGGLLLAMATWVRLWDLGVTAPEAYTLPSAVALMLVGLWHLRSHPRTPTLVALGPGLALGTVPSVLRVLVDDPVSPRALLLGLACLLLVLAGTRLHWTAPLVVGAAVGALLVVREAGPYAALVPPWLLIAVAGTTLTVIGITWERGLRDLRRGAAYLARLR